MPFSTLGAVQLKTYAKIQFATGSIEERALFRVAVFNAKEKTIALRAIRALETTPSAEATVADLAQIWQYENPALGVSFDC